MTTTGFHTASTLGMVFLGGLFLALTACASPPPHDKSYEEPDLPDDEAAILDWSGWGAPPVLAIDGKQPVGNRARVAPGKHLIRWGGWFGVSALYGRTSVEYDRTNTIEMKPGHVYDLHSTRFRTYGGFSDFLWIQDRATGEIVAGAAPPYDRNRLRRSRSAVADRLSMEEFEEISTAAGCGDTVAQQKLALYHLAAIPPVDSRDLPLAYAWYSTAGSGGDEEAARMREVLVSEMTQTQLAEAHRLLKNRELTRCERLAPR